MALKLLGKAFLVLLGCMISLIGLGIMVGFPVLIFIGLYEGGKVDADSIFFGVILYEGLGALILWGGVSLIVHIFVNIKKRGINVPWPQPISPHGGTRADWDSYHEEMKKWSDIHED